MVVTISLAKLQAYYKVKIKEIQILSFCRKTQLYKNWQTGILGWETMLFSHLVYRYQITAPDTVYIRLLFSVFGESRRQSWAEEDTKR